VTEGKNRNASNQEQCPKSRLSWIAEEEANHMSNTQNVKGHTCKVECSVYRMPMGIS
jgi:hypothetical protein